MAKNVPVNLEKALIGCLLGTAAGDSLGLPCEGLPKARLAKMFPKLDEHSFFFKRGMISDDTEHTIMVAEALLKNTVDAEAFCRDFGWKLRLWLLGMPAGVGMTTLKACLKLWLGFPEKRSGVFSAGNGPAMRSAIIGVLYSHDAEKMREMVKASTRITHTDPRALYGALAIAQAAAESARGQGVNFPRYLSELLRLLGPGAEELLHQVAKVWESVQNGETTEDYAVNQGMKKGVSGYIYHTVPVALHSWFSHPQDFKGAVNSVIRCGGDTDTVAAIVGGIIGAGVGKDGIPMEYIDEIFEWPRNIEWMEELGRNLATVFSEEPVRHIPRYNALLLPSRNLVFLATVLAHGFRRLLPPY